MDQNPNPQDTNNNVFEQNEGQPFARRTVSWAFNLGLIVLVMGLFAGWYFTASDEPDGASDGADVQMPGNRYDDDSVSGSVYDVFYGFFSGFGNDNAPVQSRGASNVQTMPVSGNGASASSQVDTNGSIAVQDNIIVPPANDGGAAPATGGAVINPAALTPENAPSYFNGKILDYEGKVAGDIKAMIRNEDGERIVYFELDQSLTPADKPRDYHIAYDEVEIAEEQGARFIKLNKEQTEALAQTLFENDNSNSEENNLPENQVPEPE